VYGANASSNMIHISIQYQGDMDMGEMGGMGGMGGMDMGDMGGMGMDDMDMDMDGMYDEF
jgi:hypothetical protein